MPHYPLLIDLKLLPEEGCDISGSLPASYFDLAPEDLVQPLSPLEYELHVQRDDHGLILSGSLESTFELECGRCGERFATHFVIDPYFGEMDLEGDDANKSIMDLTEVIRDDILVALPSYPRCEDGNVKPRECPAQGKFDAPSPIEASDDASPQDTGVWDALDKLKN